MPATAAIDNETLDHLLSVVDDSANVRCVAAIWKMEFGGDFAAGEFTLKRGVERGRRVD
jgi:hypothetical protein